MIAENIRARCYYNTTCPRCQSCLLDFGSVPCPDSQYTNGDGETCLAAHYGFTCENCGVIREEVERNPTDFDQIGVLASHNPDFAACMAAHIQMMQQRTVESFDSKPLRDQIDNLVENLWRDGILQPYYDWLYFYNKRFPTLIYEGPGICVISDYAVQRIRVE